MSARARRCNVVMSRETSLTSTGSRGVRAFAACCLADVLRIYAPDAPYTQEELRVSTDTTRRNTTRDLATLCTRMAVSRPRGEARLGSLRLHETLTPAGHLPIPIRPAHPQPQNRSLQRPPSPTLPRPSKRGEPVAIAVPIPDAGVTADHRHTVLHRVYLSPRQSRDDQVGDPGVRCSGRGRHRDELL